MEGKEQQMTFRDHIRHKAETMQALQDYSELLDEKAELFQKTQPTSVSTDKEGGSRTRVSGTDAIDNYLIKSEERNLDERLKEAREIVEAMIDRLEKDEYALRMSDDNVDRVYIYRFIEHMPAPDIASKLHFSQSWVFRIIKMIEDYKKL